MRSVKTVVAVLLVFALLGTLSSCGTGKTDGGDTARITSASETEPAAKQTELEKSLAAYKDFLTDYIAENAEDINEIAAFSLIYVDGDDIPELVLSLGDVRVDMAYLYRYDGVSVKSVGEFGDFGQLMYLPKESIVVGRGGGSGYSSETVYSYEDGDTKELHFYEKEVDYPGSERIIFSIDGEEVPYSDYRDSYYKDIYTAPDFAPDMSSANSYQLTTEGIEKCFISDGGAVRETGDDPASLYSYIISRYIDDRLDFLNDLGYYDADFPVCEYAVKDINSDGVAELVIRETDDGEPVGIGAIYTLDGKKPVELFFADRHMPYTINRDGYLIYEYHSVLIEKLVGTELVTVAESPRLSSDNYDAEYSDFLKANGISDEEMEFDFVPCA